MAQGSHVQANMFGKQTQLILFCAACACSALLALGQFGPRQHVAAAVASRANSGHVQEPEQQKRIPEEPHSLEKHNLFDAERGHGPQNYTSRNSEQVHPLDREFAQWSHGCTHLLFDLGANRGGTIQRWFGLGGLRAGEKPFSLAVDSVVPPNMRKRFCLASFEANPRWTPMLEGIASAQREQGHRVRVYTETIVADKFGDGIFYVDETSTR